MNINELYKEIKLKKEKTEKEYFKVLDRKIKTLLEFEIWQIEKLGLAGKIEAYTDVICLIESSGVLDDK